MAQATDPPSPLSQGPPTILEPPKDPAKSHEPLVANPADPQQLPQTVVEEPEEIPGTETIPRTIYAARHHKIPRARTLVLCFDGTGDQFDNDNSNVVKFFQCLKKDDPARQRTYYPAGIGTYTRNSRTKSGISSALDMAVGSGLGVHVRDGYKFLMKNYIEGDKICLFGFSRGAYTARALAGMLHKVGLLPVGNEQQIPFAYRMYKQDDDDGWTMSLEFKKTFSIPVIVEFVGAWDTVNSVGIPPRALPFAKANNAIRYFRHALALDEHRAKFKANLWVNTMEEKAKEQQEQAPPPPPRRGSKTLRVIQRTLSGDSHESRDTQDLEREFDMQDGHHMLHATHVEEVWFKGAHADVGGGAVTNDTRHSLARIPLRWMIHETFKCDTGILFHTADLADMGLDVPTLYPILRTRPAPITSLPQEIPDRHSIKELSKDKESRMKLKEKLSEELEDYFDALWPINDQLKLAKFWWILEVWPVKEWFQSQEGHWNKVIGFNLGRYRAIREESPKLHWSVTLREEKMGKKQIKNELDHDAKWAVVRE